MFEMRGAVLGWVGQWVRLGKGHSALGKGRTGAGLEMSLGVLATGSTLSRPPFLPSSSSWVPASWRVGITTSLPAVPSSLVFVTWLTWVRQSP